MHMHNYFRKLNYLLIRVRAAVAADPTDYASAAEAVQKGALLLGPLLPMGTFEGADARAELSERCLFFTFLFCRSLSPWQK